MKPKASQIAHADVGARAWVAIVVTAALVGVAIAILPAPAAPFWLALLVVGWGLSILWVFTRTPFSFPFAGLMIAMLLYVVIPATIDVTTGSVMAVGTDFSGGLVKALQISTLAQWSMLGGAVMIHGLMSTRHLSMIREKLSARRVNRMAAIMFAISLVGLVAYALIAGFNLRSLIVFNQAAGYGSFATNSTGPTILYFDAMRSAAGAALILLTLRLTSSGSRVRYRTVLPAMAVVAFFLVIDGQRFRLVVPAIACGLIWLKTRRRSMLGARRGLILGVIGLTVISALVGAGRGGGQRDYSLGNLWTQQFGPSSDLFTPIAGLVQIVPGSVPFLNGKSYAEIVPLIVPRALWPSKPTGTIPEIVHKFDKDAGLAFPEFAEMYANLGLLGVLIGSIIFGAAIEWLALRFARSTDLRESMLLAVAIALMLHLFTRGDFASTLGQALGLVVGVLVLCRRRTRTLDALAPEADPVARVS